MVQIIKEHLKERRPSFMDRIGNAAGKAAEIIPEHFMQQEQRKAQEMKMQQENSMIKQLTGMDLSGVQDPKMRQKAFELAMQSQQKEKEFGREAEFKEKQANEKNRFNQFLTAQQAENDFNKAQELQYQNSQQKQELEDLRQKNKPQEKPKDIGPLRSGMKALQVMKDLRKKGNLGIGASHSLFPSTREDAAKYSQLGKSLIPLVSSVPVRNQLEFEVMAHDLYDPNLTDAAAKGILEGMEQIIQDGIDEAEGKGKNEDVSILDNLSDEEIQKLVAETNGDIEAAKKLAMKRYSR